MSLRQAAGYAVKIYDWLQPMCERVEVAGSIRRSCATCNDVDIVCIPKFREKTDLFGDVVEISNPVYDDVLMQSLGGTMRVTSGRERPGKMMIVELRKCQLDLWFATPANLGTRLLCRTGSKEHNIVIAQLAQDVGGHWNPYDGLELGGRMYARTEAEIYEALGLPFVQPSQREGARMAELANARRARR